VTPFRAGSPGLWSQVLHSKPATGHYSTLGMFFSSSNLCGCSDDIAMSPSGHTLSWITCVGGELSQHLQHLGHFCTVNRPEVLLQDVRHDQMGSIVEERGRGVLRIRVLAPLTYCPLFYFSGCLGIVPSSPVSKTMLSLSVCVRVCHDEHCVRFHRIQYIPVESDIPGSSWAFSSTSLDLVMLPCD
jgi:hypothetical protein